MQFPNLSFVARQILKILGSQIEIEIIFTIVGVLSSCCKLGVENLDKLVIITKNWSYDARAYYMCEGKSLNDFLANEVNIIDDNDIVLDAADHYKVTNWNEE